MLVAELTGEHEDLFSTKMAVGLEALAGRPFYQGNVFMLEIVKGHDLQAALARQPGVVLVSTRTVFRSRGRTGAV